MPDVWSSYVVVEALRIIFYQYLTFTLTFVFPLDEFLVQSIVSEWFNKRTEFFFLIVTS